MAMWIDFGALWTISPVLTFLTLLGGSLAAFLICLALIVAIHRVLAAAGVELVRMIRANGTDSLLPPGRTEADGRVLTLMCTDCVAERLQWDLAIQDISVEPKNSGLATTCTAEALGEATTARFLSLTAPEDRDDFIHKFRTLVAEYDESGHSVSRRRSASMQNDQSKPSNGSC